MVEDPDGEYVLFEEVGQILITKNEDSIENPYHYDLPR